MSCIQLLASISLMTTICEVLKMGLWYLKEDFIQAAQHTALLEIITLHNSSDLTPDQKNFMAFYQFLYFTVTKGDKIICMHVLAYIFMTSLWLIDWLCFKEPLVVRKHLNVWLCTHHWSEIHVDSTFEVITKENVENGYSSMCFILWFNYENYL